MSQLSKTERALLDLVFRNRSIARVDLARQSGLTGASVTRLIAKLQEDGLFEEERAANGAQGQPKRKLTLRSDRYFGAGIVFSMQSIEAVIVDFCGAVVGAQKEFVTLRTPEGVAQKSLDLINTLMRDLPKARLIGVGAALPGNFGTFRSLLIAHELFDQFGDEHLTNSFQSAFDVPVHFENDGTAAALGEYILAQNRDVCDPLFLVHIGHGVGGGVILDGKPYLGVNGNAGLAGALYPYDKPRPSGQDLMATLSKANVGVRDLSDLEVPTPSQAEILNEWTARASTQLELAVRVVTGLFDPRKIIIGGRLPKALNAEIASRLSAADFAGPSRGLPPAVVEPSNLGPQASAIGAACLPLYRRFFAAS